MVTMDGGHIAEERFQTVHRTPRSWWASFESVSLRVVMYMLVAYSIVLVFAMWMEEAFIFGPVGYPEGDWHPDGLEIEDVEFETEDGVRLHAWYCPVSDARWVVLSSHGNAGNITHRAAETRLWQKHLGVSVFLYDYRGYGKSDGTPGEQGLYADARASYRWLVERGGVAADRIILRGRSLGSAVALELALEVAHQGLILESSFTSVPDMGKQLFPWLPVRRLMRNRFESVSKITRYSGPLLITHGTQDTIVPFRMGKELFQRANQPKWFYEIPGADHNDLYGLLDPNYFPTLRQFLDRCAAHAARASELGDSVIARE